MMCSTVCCILVVHVLTTPCGRQLELSWLDFGGLFVSRSRYKLMDSKNVAIQSVCCVFAYLLSVLSAVFRLHLSALVLAFEAFHSCRFSLVIWYCLCGWILVCKIYGDT